MSDTPSNPDFVDRTTTQRDLEKRIRKLAIARMKYFQDRLREDYGIVVKCGMEFEFFVENDDGSLKLLQADKEEEARLNRTLEESRYLASHVNTKIRQDLIPFTGECEITSRYPSMDSSRTHSPIEVANLISTLQKESKKKHPTPWSYKILAQPKPYHGKASRDERATAGLHLNVSLWSEDGRRPEFGRTSLEWHCGRALLEMQKRGLYLFVQSPQGYQRLGANAVTPSRLHMVEQRDPEDVTHVKYAGTSVVLRDTNSPNFSRIENRLPGVDSNPHLAMLGTLAAMYDAVQAHVKTTGDRGSKKIIARDPYNEPGLEPVPITGLTPSDAVDGFVRNRESLVPILGTELYDTLRSYQQIQLNDASPAAASARSV